jgi:hypothetical protein
MLQVISHNIGDRQGTVVIQADTQEEATESEARATALKVAASQGLSKPGISGNASPYPVDADGKTSDDLIMGKGTVAGYRVDFPVTGAL